MLDKGEIGIRTRRERVVTKLIDKLPAILEQGIQIGFDDEEDGA